MTGLIVAGQRLTASELTTTISNLATGSVSNSTAETVIGSLVIPAGSVANQGYEYHIEGTNDNAAVSSNVTFLLRLGTTGTTADTEISAHGAYTTRSSLNTGLVYAVWGWFRVVTAGSSGTIILADQLIQQIVGAPAVDPSFHAPSSGTFNFTVPLFLTITAQWAAASASNTTRTLSGSLAALN